jgi:hypothetical protein
VKARVQIGGPSHVSMDPEAFQDILPRYEMPALICQLRLGSSFEEVMSTLGLDLSNADDVIIYRSMLVLASLSHLTYTHIYQPRLLARSRTRAFSTYSGQECIVTALQARYGDTSAVPSNSDRLSGILAGGERDLRVCLS